MSNIKSDIEHGQQHSRPLFILSEKRLSVSCTHNKNSVVYTGEADEGQMGELLQVLEGGGHCQQVRWDDGARRRANWPPVMERELHCQG